MRENLNLISEWEKKVWFNCVGNQAGQIRTPLGARVWEPCTHEISLLNQGQPGLTHLHGLHGTDHHHGLSHTGPQPADQPPRAVQLPRLVSHLVAEKLEHPEPGEKQQVWVTHRVLGDFQPSGITQDKGHLQLETGRAGIQGTLPCFRLWLLPQCVIYHFLTWDRCYSASFFLKDIREQILVSLWIRTWWMGLMAGSQCFSLEWINVILYILFKNNSEVTALLWGVSLHSFSCVTVSDKSKLHFQPINQLPVNQAISSQLQIEVPSSLWLLQAQTDPRLTPRLPDHKLTIWPHLTHNYFFAENHEMKMTDRGYFWSCTTFLVWLWTFKSKILEKNGLQETALPELWK